jgi:hypothetical protein
MNYYEAANIAKELPAELQTDQARDSVVMTYRKRGKFSELTPRIDFS